MRMPSGRRIALVASLLAATAVLVAGGRLAWRLGRSLELAGQSEPLQQRPSGATRRLLIVGDSTGVGTGASSPQASVAGLIAQRYPKVWIENRSRDGATFGDVAGQLAAASGRFDVVLVMAGGNDVIRFTRREALRRAVDEVAARARRRAATVILMPAGNVGNAPAFFPPLSWWLAQRARRLHAVVREAAARHGAVYVDLFQERANDPFAQRPALNASDGLHPSDAGYRLWFGELVRQAQLSRWLD